MQEIKVVLPKSEPKSYPILIGNGLFKNLDLKTFKNVDRYVIITDNNVRKLYGEKLLKQLESRGLRVNLLSFSAGEKYKNEVSKQKLDHALLKLKCGRDTMILALGGGVSGDMAGFVAATYMRGIPYIHIPTSFLAMVDSSIGGKVSVDTPFGKNLIGAFHQPEAVLIDTDFLKTLLREHLINGLLEAIKIFLTFDQKYFEFVMANLNKILKKDMTILHKIIARAVELKVKVVCRDEREGNERMVLNFGHTIGHAIEHLSKYKLLHGYAVGLGILVESKISNLLGILSLKDYELIEKNLSKIGIKKVELCKFKVNDILKLTKLDKKNSSGKVKYVLLKRIGEVKVVDSKFAHSVEDKIVKQALQLFN